jgi:hypothetical protein
VEDKYQAWRETAANSNRYERRVFLAIVKQLREALEFYSKMHHCIYMGESGFYERENGEKAKLALKFLDEHYLE